MIPPVSTGARKWIQLVRRLAIALGVALITIAALVVALIANSHASDAVNCVNSALGDRNGVQTRDSAAHVDFAEALQKVLLAPKTQQAAEYQHFLTELHSYVHTLRSDQAYRQRHPFGRCSR